MSIKINRIKVQDWLHELQKEALKEYKEQESNCQCSGDGEDYAKYGALFCQAQARVDAINKFLIQLKSGIFDEPKEAEKKTVVTKVVVVDEEFLAKHLTPKEAKKK